MCTVDSLSPCPLPVQITSTNNSCIAISFYHFPLLCYLFLFLNYDLGCHDIGSFEYDCVGTGLTSVAVVCSLLNLFNSTS
jgi:hypothetical protein